MSQTDQPFQFGIEASFWDTSAAPTRAGVDPATMLFKGENPGEGNFVKIGGLVTTERLDRHGEVILQRGLDWSQFLQHGWFNDDHKRGAVVGYPTSVVFKSRGSRLPNGDLAPRDGWWVEGYLLNNPKGAELAATAKSLRGTGRSLGFSVEGTILARQDANGYPSATGKIIAKAVIAEIAVTHQPVNPDARLELLAKALSAGHAAPIGEHEPGDGAALRRQHLEGVTDKRRKKETSMSDPNMKKALKGVDDALKKANETTAPEPDFSQAEQMAQVDATGFLKSLTVANKSGFDKLGKALADLMLVSASQAVLAKAQAEAMAKLQNDNSVLAKAIIELGDSPLARKGATNPRDAEVMARFQAAQPGAGQPLARAMGTHNMPVQSAGVPPDIQPLHNQFGINSMPSAPQAAPQAAPMGLDIDAAKARVNAAFQKAVAADDTNAVETLAQFMARIEIIPSQGIDAELIHRLQSLG